MADPREDIDQLIVRTREAHEVLAEMKETERRINAAIKIAEEAKLNLVASVAAAVDNLIETAIEVGLENYEHSIVTAIQQAEESVRQRFDVLFTQLLSDMSDQLKLAIRDRPSASPGREALEQIRRTVQSKIIETPL